MQTLVAIRYMVLGATMLLGPLSNDSLLSSPETRVVGVKLVKVRGTSLEARPSMEICPACQPLSGARHEGENDLEAFFHFLAPTSPPLIPSFRIAVNDPANVAAVIVQKARLPFRREAKAIVVDLPLPLERTNSTEVHTHILEPGLDIRVEHAHPLRRAGKYSQGRWPALEHQAALNLEFGLYEATRALGLDRAVVNNHLGTILLMTFDTNYPTLGPDSAHEDWPPHFHMHMTYADGRLGNVGHFYIDESGLIAHNLVTNLAGERQDLGRGQPQRYVDATGKVLYTLTITGQGWLELAIPSGGSCLLRPVSRGFQSGSFVECDGRPGLKVHVNDDLTRSTLLVRVNGRRRNYLYDRDTGNLLASPR
ncbi:MAG: hypothetical protein H7039_21845 [Bryobacteraceae bacterium]|nr:hypothetical protein [Bryobacteraceae bacterium]